MESIIEILMRRDSMTQEEAEQLVEDAKEELYARLEEGEMPYDICAEWFGLEPDYLDELLYC